jgi:hypothetical protein
LLRTERKERGHWTRLVDRDEDFQAERASKISGRSAVPR